MSALEEQSFQEGELSNPEKPTTFNLNVYYRDDTGEVQLGKVKVNFSTYQKLHIEITVSENDPSKQHSATLVLENGRHTISALRAMSGDNILDQIIPAFIGQDINVLQEKLTEADRNGTSLNEAFQIDSLQKEYKAEIAKNSI